MTLGRSFVLVLAPIGNGCEHLICVPVLAFGVLVILGGGLVQPVTAAKGESIVGPESTDAGSAIEI